MAMMDSRFRKQSGGSIPTWWQRWIDEGAVTVNGHAVKSS